MGKHAINRVIAMLLVISLVFMQIPVTEMPVYAQGSGYTHQHDESCAYTKGAECTHVCGDSLGDYVDAVLCDHDCEEAGCFDPCGHSHDDGTCAYVAETEWEHEFYATDSDASPSDAYDAGAECDHAHDGNVPCDHEHNADCGWLSGQQKPEGETGTVITSFAAPTQSATVALGTSRADLPLPETVETTLTDAATPIDIPVEWTDEDGYDGDIPGSYDFTAVPLGYSLVDGVSAPIFTITVTDTATSTKITVARFDALDEGIEWQGYNPGEIASADELNLPATLTGADTDGEALTIESVTWECTAIVSDPDAETIAFDPNISNRYDFTAVLPEGYATAEGAFDITGGTLGTHYTYDGNVLTITQSGTYTIGMASATTTTDRIAVQSGLTGVNITLNGVSIDVSGIDYACAFDMTGATVNLTLQGASTLKSGAFRAGIGVPSGSTLSITSASTGTLNVFGHQFGAGIGGRHNINKDAGTINIAGGIVTATGGSCAAGIGGGNTGDGGTVSISGGTVIAKGGDGAGGIGRGNASTGSFGSLTVTGGSLRRISGGSSGASNETPARRGGANLYQVRLQGLPANTPITSAAVTSVTSYGTNDVYSDDSGYCYFWLPAGSAGINVTADGVKYVGSLTIQANNDNSVSLIPQTNVVQITNITGIPETISRGTFTLAGTVEPSNATNKTIVWSVQDAGGTGASISGNTLTTTAAGTLATRATVYHGLGAAHYTKDFNITVSGNDLSVSGGTLGTDYRYSGSVLTINSSKAMTITGTTSAERVAIASGITANITINGLYIQAPSYNSAFELTGTAKLNLTLAGDNLLRGGDYRAGLRVPSGAELTITAASTGSLTAPGGSQGAGIGADTMSSACGSVTINGGTVTATGGFYGAGIGGISTSNGGTVTITGGTVIAAAGQSNPAGAGIGAGSSGTNNGTLVITGGSVKRSGNASKEATATTGLGANVYLTTLAVGEPAVSNADITAGRINGVACAETPNAGSGVYGVKGVKTDGDGKLYYWLPEANDIAIRMETGGVKYTGTGSPNAAGTETVTLLEAGAGFLLPDTDWYNAQGGDGQTSFTISTAAELAGLAQLVNAGNTFAGKTVKLTANIDLTAYLTSSEGKRSWIPIGKSDNYFNGVFDGNVEGVQYVGGIAGYGGGISSNSSARGEVKGDNQVGGIAGFSWGSISNCYSMNDVTATGDYAGGIAGYIRNAVISNCYATGAVSGGAYVGGIVGICEGSDVTDTAKIQNCAALNISVTGTSNAARVATKPSTGGFRFGVLTNNIAFAGMIVMQGGSAKNISSTVTLTSADGLGKSKAEIAVDGTLGERFANDGDPWTAADGSLPGFGAAVAMPEHLMPPVSPAIVTASLPDGLIGTIYSATLKATGGSITWSIDNGGTLPTGLNLNAGTGVISGTPSAVGTFSFTVKAANEAGDVTAEFSITISKDDGDASTVPPELVSQTAISVTVKAPASVSGDVQFACKTGADAPEEIDWKESGAFTGLNPNTEYSFYMRLAETATHSASPASPALTVTTDKAVLDGSVSITGTAKYGEILSADTSLLVADPGGATAMGTLSYEWKNSGSSTVLGTGVTYCATQNGLYSVTNPTYTNAGTYTVYFKVNRAGDNYNEYSGSALSTSNLSGGTSGGTFEWTTPATIPTVTNSGYEVTFTPTDMDNYDWSSVTLTGMVNISVSPRTITITPTAGQSKTFGADDPTFAYTPSEALITGNSFTGALSREAGENAGTYAYTLGTLDAGSNYTLSLAAETFEITKATANAVDTSKSVLYTDTAAQTVDIAALVSNQKLAGDTLSYSAGTVTGTDSGVITSPSMTGDTLSFTITGGAAGNTATIPVIVSGFTNYNDTTVNINVTLTDKTGVTISGITANTNLAYNGTAKDVVKTNANAGAADVSGLSYSYEGTGTTAYGPSATAPTNAGDYKCTVTLTDAAYCAEDFVINFTITKATITITADNKAALTGDSEPSYTYTISGLVSGETLAALPTVACPTANMNEAGTYPITAYGAAAPAPVPAAARRRPPPPENSPICRQWRRSA